VNRHSSSESRQASASFSLGESPAQKARSNASSSVASVTFRVEACERSMSATIPLAGDFILLAAASPPER